MPEVAVIVGTRPEVIKLAPVVRALAADATFRPYIVSTGQHRDLASQAFRDMGLEPDVNLGVMAEAQTPTQLLSRTLAAIEELLVDRRPIGVIVQGDTTSALAGAIAAFHEQLPIAHVEAGLRTHCLQAPFPEEMNRSVIARMAAIHFCPTARAAGNLEAEGIVNGVHVTGNTVVDSLLWTLNHREIDEHRLCHFCSPEERLVLVTGHRRENFFQPQQVLCEALDAIAVRFPDSAVVIPVHPNPHVRDPFQRYFSGSPRVRLTEPLDYPTMLAALKRATLLITDSGGLQEEAPTFGTPILVTRRTTERPETIEAGCGELLALSSVETVIATISRYLTIPGAVRTAPAKNPFGDGHAADRIVRQLCCAWTPGYGK
ncbi:MAG: UDP-N-acetylglucosamine 2-epimerase (non-hydrolyzing) [Bdellovibrionales bacterium]|nr:UDP-N-acetylglucosamine 2-epimerase (non-hydrolyzing) [Bdellovibrionales bacterium]